MSKRSRSSSGDKGKSTLIGASWKHKYPCPVCHEEYMGQSIQEWTKKILWKTAFKKIT